VHIRWRAVTPPSKFSINRSEVPQDTTSHACQCFELTIQPGRSASRHHRKPSGRARHSSPGYPRMGRRAEESAGMTQQQPAGYEDFDVPLESGRLRVRAGCAGADLGEPQCEIGAQCHSLRQVTERVRHVGKTPKAGLTLLAGAHFALSARCSGTRPTCCGAELGARPLAKAHRRVRPACEDRAARPARPGQVRPTPRPHRSRARGAQARRRWPEQLRDPG